MSPRIRGIVIAITVTLKLSNMSWKKKHSTQDYDGEYFKALVIHDKRKLKALLEAQFYFYKAIQ